MNPLKFLKGCFSLSVFVTVMCVTGKGQTIVRQAPPGFDSPSDAILHGKIDTISYYSKTVGNDRKAIIYTPPDYTKTKKYPVLYLLHGIGGDEKEWLNGGSPQIHPGQSLCEE